MYNYQVFTQCGVVTHYNANNSYLAADMARQDGWIVIQVLLVQFSS